MTHAVSSKKREHNPPTERMRLALSIQSSRRIALANFHTSRVRDHATARDDIVQTANGHKARRSRYGNAPGGSVSLDTRMLRAMVLLRHRFTFRVSEIAGGSHNPGSKHYLGLAFDVDIIDGVPVNSGNPHVGAFKRRCRELGATLVLGPGDDPAHATHVHAQWMQR